MAFNNFSSNVQYNRNQNYSKNGGQGYGQAYYGNGEQWNQYPPNYQMLNEINQDNPQSNYFGENPSLKRNSSVSTQAGPRNPVPPVTHGSFPWQQSPFGSGSFSRIAPNRPQTPTRQQFPAAPTVPGVMNLTPDSLWNPDYGRKHFIKNKNPQIRPRSSDVAEKMKTLSVTGVTGVNAGPIAGNGTGITSAAAQRDFTWMLQEPGMVFGSNQAAKDKNKAGIKAERKNSNMEPKAWLYAWLGFRHIRPEYSHESVGQRPDQHFKCSLKVEKFPNKVALGQAPSKKEATTEAAWDFIEFLNESGELTQSEREHITRMKKKITKNKGENNEEDNTLNSSSNENRDESVKLDTEEKIKREVEDIRKNEVWIEPKPAWLIGEQKVTPMDEYWRKKELETTRAGNCPGGPVVTPGGLGTKVPYKGNPVPDCTRESGSPLLKYPYPVPPFDPTVPPPPLPPMPTGSMPPVPPPTMGQTQPTELGELYKNPPPVIYYPTVPTQIPLEQTPEKTQTASNIRDMLDDITKELEEESNFFDFIPRRNSELEPLDYEILNYCHSISMKEEKYSAICKVRNIVEQSLRQLSNYLVKEECDRLGRADLVEFVELKLLNRETVKILKRRSQPNHEKDEKHEEIKKQINKLRIVKKVIRTGNFAMDLLTDELKKSELVLFTDNIPTKSLLVQIVKILPLCIDKSLNLGVELKDETIIIEGEILNEIIQIDIRVTSERVHDITHQNQIESDWLSIDGMQSDLRNVRRVDWWQSWALNVYPIIDKIASLFIWLRNEPHGEALQLINEWQLVLVIFFALGSIDVSHLSPTDAISRIFEALSSGMLLSKLEIRDPSEPNPVNFLENLDCQSGENVARWGGKCVRLIGFDRIQEIFKIDFNNNQEAQMTHDDQADDDKCHVE